jgi:virginiamycin B lyase
MRSSLTSLRRPGSLLLVLVSACVLACAARAQAAPPVISETAFSQVTETGATLQASVDPTGGKTNAHFEYTTLAEYEAHGFEGAEVAPAEPIGVPSQVKGIGDLTSGSEFITAVSTTAGIFAVGQTITAGAAIPAETKIVGLEVEAGKGTLRVKLSKSPIESVSPANLIATGSQPIAGPVTGLTAGSAYVFRAVAKKVSGGDEGRGPATTFSTYGPAPTFSACPNDEFRNGAFAPSGVPGRLLPDCRSFELASPLDKNGNDVTGTFGYLRAADDGSAITFGSTFGIPGGEGAQQEPFYEAFRGEAGWSTNGLQPPATTGPEVHVLVGQLPDLSATYAIAEHPGNPNEAALFELHRDGSPATEITPYVGRVGSTVGDLAFAGASADAGTVAIEAPFAFPEAGAGPKPPGAAPGAPNVYAWDRSSGTLHLASVMNSASETEAKLAKGAYAGPYDWASDRLSHGGGPAGGYYVTDEHAVSAEGAVFFTSRSTGHLYQRLNPTQPQSAVLHSGEADEECTEAARACTVDVSANHRTSPDSAGEQPAAFQAAANDGSSAFFTSSEELTDNANTGPPQPPAQIGRANLHGEGAADEVNEGLLPTHALGVAVDPQGEYIYWADPSKGTIGRAKLDGSGDLVPGSTEPTFIEPGEGECPQVVKDAQVVINKSGEEVEVPPVFEDMPIPSKPRYVAVDEGHVYWTNTGRTNAEGPIDGGGTIGRAQLKPDHSAIEGEAEPAFICGAAPNQVNPNTYADRLASNPQGIAVDSEYIYWANAGQGSNTTIARAAIAGTDAEARFSAAGAQQTPYGVTVDSEYVYWSGEDSNNNKSYITRKPLAGGEPKGPFIGESGLRGIAVDSGHLYWTTQGEGGEVGRVSLGEFNSNCPFNPTCAKEFIDVEGIPDGLAPDGSHLFWSVNGESPKSPGTDLYRYRRAAPEPERLTDLTPDSSDPNGAEVQGVLGTSTDGSDVYFVANAVLDDNHEAEPGDCGGHIEVSPGPLGECNIYLDRDGQIEVVARVRAEPDNSPGAPNSLATSDATDWEPKANYAAGLQKTSMVSGNGRTLVFRSQLPQSPVDNHGTPEYYRYRVGEGIACLTCDPSGLPGGGNPLGSLVFPFLEPGSVGGATQVRFASADGNRFFFETAEPMVSYDNDGAGGCPLVGGYSKAPACQDVYEWEAPGSGTCVTGAPGYSPVNQGCIYLISQGSQSDPAFFLGASASGDDAFFVTRSQLVGEDTDQLRDVYDARVDGGFASQNPIAASSCEGEACELPTGEAPAVQAPPQFSGPPNPKPKRCKGKRCHKKHKQHKHRKQSHRRTAAK